MQYKIGIPIISDIYGSGIGTSPITFPSQVNGTIIPIIHNKIEEKYTIL